MKPTEETKRHLISRYVEPARQKGERTFEVRVGTIQKELGWTNRTPSVFSTLTSKEFQQEAGVTLVEKTGGPASGGPSTTWKFIYEVLDTPEHSQPATAGRGNDLKELFGLCRETFAALGGGEEFLRREREWGPDAWELYDAEVPERNRKAVEG
jgi:hypothetical protein